MSRLARCGCACLIIWLASAAPRGAQDRPSGRPLTIEDYYRIQTIGDASISPNGKWVAFSVSTRLEEPEANSSRSDSWLVPSDASAEPRRVQHEGKDVSNPGWTDDGWLQVQRRRTAVEG